MIPLQSIQRKSILPHQKRNIQLKEEIQSMRSPQILVSVGVVAARKSLPATQINLINDSSCN